MTLLYKKILTYLSPINAPITDSATIETVQECAKRKDTLYANTLDVGATMTAYKVLWNFQDKKFLLSLESCSLDLVSRI